MSKDNAVMKIFQIIVLAIVLLSLFGYAILYYLSLALFPWFVAFYIIAGIASLIFGFLTWHNWDDDPGLFGIPLLVTLGLFLFCMWGASTTGELIKTIPQTEAGKSSLQAWNDVWFFVGIPTYIAGEFDRALNQQLNEICIQQGEEACRLSKTIIEQYKESQELKDWINSGKKLYDFVESKNKK